MIQITAAPGSASRGSSQPISLRTLLPPSSPESPAKLSEGWEGPSTAVSPPGSRNSQQQVPSPGVMPWSHGVQSRGSWAHLHPLNLAEQLRPEPHHSLSIASNFCHFVGISASQIQCLVPFPACFHGTAVIIWLS